MVQFHVYPGGKKRIVTFSYDDGNDNDQRLVELFNKYNVKGTFHLNGEANTLERIEVLRNRYIGHEISCHTVKHGWPARMPLQSVVNETMQNRIYLEKIANYPVIGMSYPSGSYDEMSETAMKMCGIVYSRTTKSTLNFLLPENFMEWHPSCHHRDALKIIDKFIADLDSQWTHPLCYIWGHSHELRTEEDWATMETIVSKLANNEKIWYATNIEIYNYLQAQKQLQISANEKIFYNPTAIDVWVEINKVQIICIPAGKTIILD